jgi:hypothetical protein
VKPLQPPDTFHLSAAIGWIGLGNWREANEELEKITFISRVHPDVLEIRWQICAKAAKWEQSFDIGNALVSEAPERPFGWIRRSFALHCLKRTAEAVEGLAPATVLFPKEWLEQAQQGGNDSGVKAEAFPQCPFFILGGRAVEAFAEK